MAINIGSTLGTIADSSSVTGTIVLSGNSNQVLVVAAGAHQGNVGTVTLNGTSITKVIQGTTEFNEQINLWFYNAPPATGTIVASADTAAGVGFIAMEYNGVAQSGNPVGSA